MQGRSNFYWAKHGKAQRQVPASSFSALHRLSQTYVLFVLCMLAGASAHAASQCYQWRQVWSGGAYFNSGWLTDPQAVSDAFAMHCNSRPYGTGASGSSPNSSCYTGCNSIGVTSCVFESLPITHTVFPAAIRHIKITWTGTSYGEPYKDQYLSNSSLESRLNPAGCGAYVSAMFLPSAQCGAICNGVGDPVNPASGAVYSAQSDVSSSIDSYGFNRFYNSGEGNDTPIGVGWRHGFSRNIKEILSTIIVRPYVQSVDNSSVFATPDAACGTGFSEIKNQVPAWSGATSQYVNGVCRLSKSGVSIGSIPVYTQVTGFAFSSSAVAYDVIRDDGQVLRFVVSNGAITAPPATKLELASISSGYTVTDGNDSVESYDSNGRLLTITSRSGVVKMMSYDAQGRLSAVTDSFGRQLIYGYNPQGKISSVALQ